jgi:hypothetical protein
MLNTKWIGRAEWLVSIVLLLTVLALFVVRTTHAGPLWRDECGMVQLASLPRVADILENFQHEASPPLFAGIVHFYIALFGTSAAALCAFGLVVGTGIIAVAWLNSHRTCGRPPLLFLALIGLNVTFLVSGTSVRGYGLGSLLFLLTLGLAVNSFRSPAMLDVALATVASIAALYCLANNVPLIAALGFSFLAAFLLRRRIRAALIVAVALGFIALLYLPVALRYFRSDWTVIIKVPIPLSLVAQKFSAALGAPFLFVAACTTTMRLVRLALPIATLLVMPFALWNSIAQRATNMDLVVAKLQQDAGVRDLILVNPWWTGISFQWHYHGYTPWVTIPPIADLRFHRYDLGEAGDASTGSNCRGTAGDGTNVTVRQPHLDRGRSASTASRVVVGDPPCTPSRFRLERTVLCRRLVDAVGAIPSRAHLLLLFRPPSDAASQSLRKCAAVGLRRLAGLSYAS